MNYQTNDKIYLSNINTSDINCNNLDGELLNTELLVHLDKIHNFKGTLEKIERNGKSFILFKVEGYEDKFIVCYLNLKAFIRRLINVFKF